MAQHNSGKRYPAEFKRDVVELVRSAPERPVAEIAAELGVTAQSLRNRVGRARIEAGEGEGGALTSDEREELRRLRREVAELRKEKEEEILRKAAACSAAETTR